MDLSWLKRYTRQKKTQKTNDTNTWNSHVDQQMQFRGSCPVVFNGHEFTT